jgi:uncharacterized surface protein with fasciclin (FAS1) repeats
MWRDQFMPMEDHEMLKMRTLTALAVSASTIALAACSPAAEAPAEVEAEAPAMTEQTVMVGGAEMYPSRTIVENAANSADHTTLVAAVQAAGLVETLSGAGPFTVFAPTNAAFNKLPAGTVERLTQADQRAALTKILTYHVVAGRITASDLAEQITAGGGRATLTTVQGGTLTATRSGNSVVITDASGATSTVTIPDVLQSNGVIHVVDTELTPPA